MAKEQEAPPDTEPVVGPSPTVRRARPRRGAPPPPTLAPGTLIDQYRIVRLVARGGMGEVYLARDVVLGRRAALKVVRSEELRSPRAKERIIAEAQATARFNHPHIVTIYGVGEHAGRPYVALEYIEGQNLHERLREGKPSLPDSLRIGLAIAEALEEAHREGVLHRDLKPANIVMARDGRLRVVDFGIATAAAETSDGAEEDPTAPDLRMGGLGTGGGGTPQYMAPEQWLLSEPSPGTDVWALGLILFELISGRGPFDAPAEGGAVSRDGLLDLVRRKAVVIGDSLAPRLEGPEVPTELSDLVARCLAKRASERPSASDVAGVLRSLARRGGAPITVDESPFRGLLSFTERQAHLFFGRSDEVARLLERLRDQPILAVVGPSGSGKSSLVQAGLVPRLREQTRTLVIPLRPGARPFATLASRLVRVTNEGPESRAGAPRTQDGNAPVSIRGSWSPPSRPSLPPPTELGAGPPQDESALATRLAASPAELGLLLRRLAAEQGVKVVLFVDQLEEVATLVPDASERRAFMEAVCSAADEPEDPVRVVLALRDDFLGRLATGPRAREALANIFVMQGMEGARLAAVLEEPLAVVGYRFEDERLAEEMVASVKGEPTSLPLLQFAAEWLWQERDVTRRLLLRSAYERMGGVAGALARHADGVLDGLSPEGRKLARAIVLRLVTPDGTRRAVRAARALEGLGPEARGVLDDLVGARLVSSHRARSDDRDDALVELTHESLLSAWSTLARWLDESREEALLLAELGHAAELWEGRGKPRDALYRGEVLLDAERHLARLGAAPPPRTAAFLSASRVREDRRKRRARFGLLTGLATLAGLAAAASVTSLYLGAGERRAQAGWDAAEAQRAEALRQRAASLREGARAAQSNGELLEARAKVRLALELEDHPEARALFFQLEQEPRVLARALGAPLYAVEISPDGATVASAGQGTTLFLVDTRTGAERRLRGHGDQIRGVRFFPDGTRIASVDWTGHVLVWDVASGALLRRMGARPTTTYALAISPDGGLLAEGGEDGSAYVWDLATGTLAHTLTEHDAPLRAALFTRDGALLTASKQGRILAYAPGLREPPTRVAELGVEIDDLDASPDGAWLAVGAGDDRVHLVSRATGISTRTFVGHGDDVVSVRFSPDGRLLASAGLDRTVRVWDVASGAQQGEALVHGDVVRGVAFGPAGQTLASASHDGLVRLFRTERLALAPHREGHTRGVHRLAVDPAGRAIVTSAIDDTLRLWEPNTGAELARVPMAAMLAVGVNAHGILALGRDETLRKLELPSGRPQASTQPLDGAGSPAFFSPRGDVLATRLPDRSVALLDTVSGARLATLAAQSADVRTLAWSADATQLATGGEDGVAHVWSRLGAHTASFAPQGAPLLALAFSPDGRTLAAASSDGALWLADLGTRTRRELAALHARVYDLAWSPSGGELAAAVADGAVHVLSPSGAPERVLEGHRGEVNVVAWGPGNALFSAGDDGTLRRWEGDTGRPAWRAPALLPAPPRLLSHRGWTTLAGPESLPPPSAFRAALEGRAARVALHADSGTACLATHEGLVELWDLAADAVVRTAPTSRVDDLEALPSACFVRAGKEVWLARGDSPARSLPLGVVGVLGAEATALGRGPAQVLVATEQGVSFLDASGRVARALPLEAGIVALAATPLTVAVGYRDGAVLLHAEDGVTAPRALADVPAAPATTFAAGPRGTLAVGFASGDVGLWTPAGAPLFRTHLHGAVSHLLLEGDWLHAVTELGSHGSFDLGVLREDYCAMLTRVARSVPVVWRDGHAERAELPPEHPCAR
jgi:WD40 repeat protein/serine/threonine protein kinase